MGGEIISESGAASSRYRGAQSSRNWGAASPGISKITFNEVQALLQSRNPKRTPPRVVNGPTFLAGLARCGCCGAAMIQNTGKGGLYRYYCCSSKLKKGPS